MAKGLFAGLTLGAVAAAAGYAYYKSLSEEEQANFKAKVEDVYGDVADKVVDYKDLAADQVADWKALKFLDDDPELKAKFDDIKAKGDDLKSQAQDLINQAKAKAQETADDIKAKVAPDDEDDIDIVLDPTAPSLADAFVALDDDDDETLADTASEAVDTVEDKAADAAETVSDAVDDAVDAVTDDK
ncbi:MAG: hypothetical protein LBT80_00755 [Lactobacillaceae bacterium]|jgi:gas vesicle protein|nr:hypothetical protein [Lactobacillaceae bacterium]